MPVSKVKPTTVTLKVSHTDPVGFRWIMYFNAFALRHEGSGCMAQFGWSSSNGVANEIVQVFVSREGIDHLRATSREYIALCADVSQVAAPSLVGTKYFNPLFANLMQLAHTGLNAEIGFFTVPLQAIAQAHKKGRLEDVRPVQVALLHSDLETHKRFLLSLVADESGI